MPASRPSTPSQPPDILLPVRPPLLLRPLLVGWSMDGALVDVHLSILLDSCQSALASFVVALNTGQLVAAACLLRFLENQSVGFSLLLQGVSRGLTRRSSLSPSRLQHLHGLLWESWCAQIGVSLPSNEDVARLCFDVAHHLASSTPPLRRLLRSPRVPRSDPAEVTRMHASCIAWSLLFRARCLFWEAAHGDASVRATVLEEFDLLGLHFRQITVSPFLPVSGELPFFRDSVGFPESPRLVPRLLERLGSRYSGGGVRHSSRLRRCSSTRRFCVPLSLAKI
jgi:hypothetical protein